MMEFKIMDCAFLEYIYCIKKEFPQYINSSITYKLFMITIANFYACKNNFKMRNKNNYRKSNSNKNIDIGIDNYS